ncbi:MAG TPA: hypothetical protein VK590_05935 [Saprospiraceae bacterium]|nr:hypothetical protein [Saprospiraceae bacterium]
MIKYINAPHEWFYSDTFDYWQKTRGKVVVYVSRLMYGYQVQLYYRGKLSYCELEARTSDQDETGYLKMFVLGEIWLDKYSDGNSEKIRNDSFHIANPKGFWISNHEEKKYWI